MVWASNTTTAHTATLLPRTRFTVVVKHLVSLTFLAWFRAFFFCTGKARRKREGSEGVCGYQAHKAPRSIFESGILLSELGEVSSCKEDSDPSYPSSPIAESTARRLSAGATTSRDRTNKRHAGEEEQSVSATVSTMMVQIPLSKVPAAELIEKKTKPQVWHCFIFSCSMHVH